MTHVESSAPASPCEGVASDEASGSDLERESFIHPAREPNVPRLTLIDVNELVRHLAPRLARILRKQRSLSLLLSKDLGLIVADAKQLDQLLIDIALRARSRHKGAGTLTILTRSVAPGTPGLPADHSCDPPRRYIALDAYFTGDAGPETIYLPRVS